MVAFTWLFSLCSPYLGEWGSYCKGFEYSEIEFRSVVKVWWKTLIGRFGGFSGLSLYFVCHQSLGRKPMSQGCCWCSDNPCIATALLLNEDRAVRGFEKTPLFLTFLWQWFSVCVAWMAGCLSLLAKDLPRLFEERKKKKNRHCNLLQKYSCVQYLQIFAFI